MAVEMAQVSVSASASALRSRLPRRKKRTAGATPSRVAKRRDGQSRSVLEALLAGDESDGEGAGGEEEQHSGLSPAGGKESVKSAQKRKRRRKERQRVKRRMPSAGGAQGGEPEPESVADSDKENAARDGNSQPRTKDPGRDEREEAVSSSSNQDDEEEPGEDGGGSPVVQKRLFASNPSASSEESDAQSDPAGDEGVDEVEERRNYRRFVTKYAAATTASVLEAVTPRDEKKWARRAEMRVPSPVQEADEPVLSQSRASEIQYRDTDDDMDDEDWQAGVIQDDDELDPTYKPGVSDRRSSLRSAKKKKKKKARTKTEKAIKADRSPGTGAVGGSPSGSVDVPTDGETVVKSERRKKRTRSTVLTNWSVEWPLQMSSPEETKARDLRLVLVGEVDGKPARFQVAKRLSATHFTSSTNDSVVLDGPFTENPAEGELPPGFVELMSTGVPAHWKRHLAPFLPGGLSPPSKPKNKRYYRLMATLLTCVCC